MSDELLGHLQRTARFFGMVLAVPLMLGLLSGLLGFLVILLVMIVVPALLLGIAIGAFLYGRDGIRLAVQPGNAVDRLIAGLAAPAIAVGALFLLWPVWIAAAGAATATRLLLNQGAYERIIAEAQNGRHGPDGYQEKYGIDFEVDRTGPVRIAFEPEGILDNWSGIVFDPTGDVMKADGFDPVTGRFRAPDEVTKLFGGDLVGCRWMWSDFYSCSFT